MKYSWQCSECETVVVVDRKMAQMSNAPESGEIDCDCSGEYTRILDVLPLDIPNGAYGGGKFHAKAWSKHVERANLLVEKARTPEGKRKEVNDDIKKLDNS